MKDRQPSLSACCNMISARLRGSDSITASFVTPENNDKQAWTCSTYTVSAKFHK